MIPIEPSPKASLRLLPINFLGLAAFGLSVGAMAIVRWFIPDDLMMQPLQPWSGTTQVVATIYVFAWAIWTWIYFRVSDSFWLTAFGAAWAAIGLLALAAELLTNHPISLLPAFTGFSLFFSFSRLMLSG